MGPSDVVLRASDLSHEGDYRLTVLSIGVSSTWAWDVVVIASKLGLPRVKNLDEHSAVTTLIVYATTLK